MTTDRIAAASAETERLARELDITNADHIALWLEANMADSSLAWLACRIVEAHEAAISTSASRDAVAWRYRRDYPGGYQAELEHVRCTEEYPGWTETALVPLSKPTPVEAGLREAIEQAADAWDAFVKAREAMNAAVPDLMAGTPAERALYDERYRADHEAEREHFRTAIVLAQSSRAILAALSETLPGQPQRGGNVCHMSPDGRHQVDTSMESGPNNCFYCEVPMPRASPPSQEDG